MRSKWTWALSPVLLLLAGSLGCSEQTGTPKTTPTATASAAPRTAGCQVERLDDAIAAVRQLSETDAYVYKIDGELSNCRFEILHKPDEESEERIVYSANGDDVVDSLRQFIATAENPKVDQVHHVLAIQIPDSIPQRDDAIVFSFSAECKTGPKVINAKTNTSGSLTSHTRDAKRADEILPSSFFDLVTSNQSSSRGPLERGQVRPGKERVMVDVEQRQREENSSEGAIRKKRNFLRYRVIVHCLAEDEASTKDDN